MPLSAESYPLPDLDAGINSCSAAVNLCRIFLQLQQNSLHASSSSLTRIAFKLGAPRKERRSCQAQTIPGDAQASRCWLHMRLTTEDTGKHPLLESPFSGRFCCCCCLPFHQPSIRPNHGHDSSMRTPNHQLGARAPNQKAHPTRVRFSFTSFCALVEMRPVSHRSYAFSLWYCYGSSGFCDPDILVHGNDGNLVGTRRQRESLEQLIV
jgi:hypothetical protein